MNFKTTKLEGHQCLFKIRISNARVFPIIKKEKDANNLLKVTTKLPVFDQRFQYISHQNQFSDSESPLTNIFIESRDIELIKTFTQNEVTKIS